MGTLLNLRSEAKQSLEIHVEIIPLVGGILQDNERFRAEIAVFNRGHPDISDEQFIFRNLRLEVRPCVARLLGADEQPVSLLNFELDDVAGNQWAGRPVSFESFADFSWEEVYETLNIPGVAPEEELFSVKLYADLDVSNFFVDLRLTQTKVYDVKQN